MQVEIPQQDLGVIRRALDMAAKGLSSTAETRGQYRSVLQRLEKCRPTRTPAKAVPKGEFRG